jgi:hypothetical protein
MGHALIPDAPHPARMPHAGMAVIIALAARDRPGEQVGELLSAEVICSVENGPLLRRDLLTSMWLVASFYV